MNTWDEAKRAVTLAERGLDFADAERVFEGPTVTMEDGRKDYGENRYITVGFLEERIVVLVWTPRDGGRRIISMRKANDREVERYAPDLG
ncbi:BrnT family toxin [Oleispirillum naphthae]|uniref:BrnT family toxin n=1 Tax=Oleispirillum naphthae TaxID=2838853 RepID=UPI00308228C8